jgi:hypothetical protein
MKQYMFMYKTYDIYLSKEKAQCKKYSPFKIWWSLTYGQVYI